MRSRRARARALATAARTHARSARPRGLDRPMDDPTQRSVGRCLATQQACLTSELDPDALGRAHELACGIDQLELLDRLVDRLGDDLARLDGGDVTELALGDQLDRFDAEPRRELAI